MDALNYPLEQLLTIKKKRFEQALQIMEAKKKILENNGIPHRRAELWPL